MGFYHRHIFPRYIDRTMRGASFEKYRHDTAGAARGVVLEVGFGSGLNLPHYSDITMLYALEPSKELYALGSKGVGAVSFPITHLCASAEHIPLPDNSVDSVVSTWSLCSIPHPEQALREIARVLKPDGAFHFAEHGKSPQKGTALLQHLLTPLSKHLAGGCHLQRDIGALVRGAGFTIQTLEMFDQKGKPLSYLYIGKAIMPLK